MTRLLDGTVGTRVNFSRRTFEVGREAIFCD